MDESLTKIRHERSRKDFPKLDLEDDEYVEFFFRRAKACLMMICGGTFFGIVVILLVFLLILMGHSVVGEMGKSFLFIIFGAMLVVVFFGWLISLIVYRGNKLYITNKRVTQMIMHSPVSTSVNVIDLTSVEDVSFKQENLWQKLFKYGTFRLSTVGDETTYTFKYSDVSPEELKAITKLVSDVKNKKHEEK